MKILITNYDYPGLVKGLTDLGHTVYNSDTLNWWTWCWGTASSKPKTSLEFHSFLTKFVTDNEVDAVLIGKGFDSNKVVADSTRNAQYWHIPSDTIDVLKGKGIATIWLSLDQPDDFTFSIRSGIPQKCDAIGSCCADVIKYYARYTKAPVFEFWPAWDQTLREATLNNEPKEYDFLMVGTPYWTPNDSFGIPRKDVVQAAIDVGVKPTIYGPDHWIQAEHGGDPALEPYYKGFAQWDDLHKIFSKAKVTYNSFLRRGFRYVNDRIFIAGGSNTLLLMEDQLGLEQEFTQGVHVGYHKHKDIDDFKQKLKYWLSNDDLREKCSLNMRELILQKHTYVDRAAKLDEMLRKLPAKQTKKRCCRGS